MNGGKRKLSPWNLLVQKVYREGKAKNKDYEFKQALVDASKRKSEMGTKKHKGGRSRSAAMAGGKSRRRRTRSRR